MAPGDAMYISQGAVPAFEYYAPVYGLAAVEYVSGDLHDLENPAGIAMQLGTLKGNPRVWILMSHVYEKGEFNEKDFILNELRQMGFYVADRSRANYGGTHTSLTSSLNMDYLSGLDDDMETALAS